jgi:hypothetical protein
MNTNHEAKKSNPKPVTLLELRTRATCKKRYGQASLTINRWGGFGRLAGEGALAEAINNYREGKATAEDVAWAFVRARITSHSPTFSWKGADLGRLITLVAECSEDPHFEAREPEALAAELIRAQDEEIERLRKFGEQIGASLRRSTESINSLSRLLMAPHITQLAASQTRSLDAISKALASSLTMRMIGDPPAIKSLSAVLRSTALPTFQPTASLAAALAVPKVGLLSARFRLPDSSYSQLARSLEGVAANYRVTIPPSLLGQLTAKQTLRIGDVLSAARATAVEIEREGGVAEAKVLEAATAEVEQVAETPSLEGLEQMIGDLGRQVEEGFREEHERSDEHEQRRRQDRDADRQLQIVLWFIAIYLSFYIALYFHLLGVRQGP